MKQLLLLIILTIVVPHLTSCGTIGGTLSGIGSDLSCAGEWCTDLGTESSYSNSGDYRPPNR